jgi:hypothetical protein
MKIVTFESIPTRLISVEKLEPQHLIYSINEGKVSGKLHTVSHSPRMYAFICMDDSECWNNGKHPSIAEAIRAELSFGDNSVIVLDSLDELKEYL